MQPGTSSSTRCRSHDKLALMPCKSCLVAVIVAWCLAALTGCAPQVQRYQYTQKHMGVEFGMVLYAPSAEAAELASQAAYARIAELDALLSDYDPASELSKLSQSSGSGTAFKVSPDTMVVLRHALEVSRKSDGAFDVTIGPCTRLWRKARRDGALPSPELLEEARNAVGWQHVKLDEAGSTVTLEQPHMRLDLGALAPGYAADEAMRLLRKQGIRSALVDASGDVVLGDAPPGQKGWKVALAPLDPQRPKPSMTLYLSKCSISTSGDLFRFVEIGGKHYSHLIDPRTGLGVTDRRTTTVIAPTGITSDALASAVYVMGPKAGLSLVEQTPEAAAIVVEYMPQGAPRLHTTARFRELLQDSQKP